MGFPENFKLHGNLGECYKQVGNSVCIPMVSEIAQQLKEQIFLGRQEEENGNDFIAEKEEKTDIMDTLERAHVGAPLLSNLESSHTLIQKRDRTSLSIN